MNPPRPTWAEIDLSASVYNIRCIRSLLAPNVKVLAMIKAEAYGHGMAGIARAAERAGASLLGFASLSEALALTEARSMPRLVVVERDYGAVAEKLVALGPLAIRMLDRTTVSTIAVVAPVMVLVMLTALMMQLQSFPRLAMVVLTAPLGLIGVTAALLVSRMRRYSNFRSVSASGLMDLAFSRHSRARSKFPR